MPKWGMSQELIETEPWGLAQELLEPAKTITDPVHGDIYTNVLENLIIDSPPMQRLRRVRQLGTTHLIYPGATHSRLSHSLGTLRAAQDLLDAVWNSRTSPQARDLPDNLMAEWAESQTLPEEFARATVLARLGALMHDLCHVPMGHTVEDDLRILTPHDGNVERFERLWAQIDPRAREAIEAAGELLDELRILIVSKDDHAKSFDSSYPFVGDIVGNTICADLIDYLQRDHYFTGLPLALGKRFMDSFFVVDSNHPYFAKQMVIKVEREGRTRNDITSELLKYLRYRYELTERALTHHAKTAADAMLGKMLELWYDELFAAKAEQLLPGIDTTKSLNELREHVRTHASPVDEQLEGSGPPPVDPVKSIDLDVRDFLENQFLTRSDDGLLEHIAEAPDTTAGGGRRSAARRELAHRLIDRKLYKVLGHAGSRADQANAKQTHKKFASAPNDRRDLEKAAADFAGIKHGWQVVVWLPGPKMKQKVADVLVHKDGTIAALSEVESASREIVERHQHLWGVTVYAPEEVRNNRVLSDAVLAYLSDKLALTFKRPDESVAPGVRDLAVDTVLRLDQGTKDRRPELAKLARLPKAAHRPEERESFIAVIDALWNSGVEEGIINGPARPPL